MTTKWISVKDRLPEEDQRVLVYDSLHKEITIGEAPIGDDGFWFIVESFDPYNPNHISGDITHWMPLLEAPKLIKRRFKCQKPLKSLKHFKIS